MGVLKLDYQSPLGSSTSCAGIPPFSSFRIKINPRPFSSHASNYVSNFRANSPRQKPFLSLFSRKQRQENNSFEFSYNCIRPFHESIQSRCSTVFYYYWKNTIFFLSKTTRLRKFNVQNYETISRLIFNRFSSARSFIRNFKNL